MTEAPLMPKATAVWLVEKHVADVDQIAEILQIASARGQKASPTAKSPPASRAMTRSPPGN